VCLLGKKKPTEVDHNFLRKLLAMLADPLEDVWEAKFATFDGTVDKLKSLVHINFDGVTIASQEHVSGSKGYPLIAIEKAVIVSERLQQRDCFLGVPITYSADTAEPFN
jgi:hypothetical protein